MIMNRAETRVAPRRVTVPTAPRNQTTQLVNGGIFDCDGYKSR